jgi:DNA-binding NarL/FixJ family response regulator
VVLFDMAIPDGVSRHRALIDVRRVVRSRPFIAHGLHEPDEDVLSAFEAGAAPFVRHNDSIEELVRTIHTAPYGEFRCPPRIARTMQERPAKLSDQRASESRLERLS